MGVLSGWRWCDKCQVLWYAGGGRAKSVCPADPVNGHDWTGSGNYSLIAVPEGTPSTPGLQTGWRQCGRCAGLFFGQITGICPAPGGGGHVDSGAGDLELTVWFSDSSGGISFNCSAQQQPGWWWCKNCSGLFWGKGSTHGVCPNGGGGHDASWSGLYAVTSGPRFGMLNLFLQDPTTGLIRMASSPDGTLANLAIEDQPLFNTGPISNSPIAVAQSNNRIWFANVTDPTNPSPNNLNLGWYGTDLTLAPPQPTGLSSAKGLPLGPYTASPALVFGDDGALYLFYRKPDSIYSSYGDTWVVQVVPTASGFTLTGNQAVSQPNDVLSGGRISSAVGEGEVWAAWARTGINSGPNNFSPTTFAQLGQPETIYSPGITPYGAGCLFTLPTTENLGIGYGGEDGQGTRGYYWNDLTATPGAQAARLNCPAPDLNQDATFAVSKDGTSFYVASVSNTSVNIYRFSNLNSAPFESATLDFQQNLGYFPPAILCTGPGGIPSS